MGYQTHSQHRMATARIVAIYALFGLGWIYGSDTVLGWLVYDPVVMVKIAVIKGSLFIVCTATLLYFLINRFVKQITTAEIAHLDSLADYQTIFNATNEAILVHHAENGRILDINDRMLEIYGYTRDEALNADIGQLSEGLPPYSQAEAIDNVRKAMFEGPHVFEWRSRKKTGELFWSEVSLRRVTTSSHDRIIAVVRDISDRKQAEFKLRNSEKLLESSQRIAHLGSWTLDLTQNRLVWSDEVYRIFGLTPQEFGATQEAFFEFVHPDDRSMVGEAFAESLQEDKEGFEVEHRIIRKSTGEVRIVHEKCTHIRNEEGKVIRSDGMVHDITERKQAEAALKKSEEKFSLAFKSTPEALAITSMEDGTYLEVNDAFLEISGLNRDQIISHTSTELGFWLDLTERQKFMDRLTTDGSLNNYEVQYRVKNDEVRDFLVSSEIIEIEGKQCSLNFIKDITERKQADLVLREREHRFRSIFNYSPVAIGLSEAVSGKMVEVNDAWLRLFGYTHDEAIGRTTDELSLYVKSEERLNIINIVKDHGMVVNYPVQLRHNSGSVIDIQYSAELINLDAKPYLQVMMTDITELKLAEQALKKSEYFFKESQRSASIGSYYADFIAGEWESSDVLDTIFGIDKDYNRSIQGWLDIIHPDDRDYLDRYLKEEVVSNRTPFSMEYRIIRRNDGETRWVNGRGTAEFDNYGNMLSLIGTIQDITEHKIVEEALRRNESHYRSLFDNALIGVAVTDKNYYFTDVNEAYCTLLGYRKEELVGKKCIADISYLDDAEKSLAMINLLRSKEIDHYTLEKRYVKKTGEIITALLFVKGNYSKEGDLEGSTASVLDISSRIKTEEEKQALEHQLLHAQKLESLGVLAGGIAHDFNNILAIIVGHCSLALMDRKTADTHIPEIERAAERAAGLCRQMLAYAGKEQFELKAVNIGEVVGEMVTMLKATIHQNVAIKQNLAVGIPPVMVDTNQIRQVIMNLIINASEAIGDAQGEVFVTVTRTAVRAGQQEKDHLGNIIPPGSYACLEVTDNGCGMNEEIKRRIFEPFYTTKFTGRGLGMSAVLGIITAHKGAVQLLSEPGKGTTFKVFLPIQANCTEELLPQQEAPSAPWHGSGTVLLVEDEVVIMSLAKEMLNMLGFSTLEARNGREALALYQKFATDITLVVTDMGMPVMDGYALVSELKKIAPKLPIIVSSGFGEGAVKERIAPDDIAGIVSKPYNFNQMRDVLRSVVEDQQTD